MHPAVVFLTFPSPPPPPPPFPSMHKQMAAQGWWNQNAENIGHCLWRSTCQHTRGIGFHEWDENSQKLLGGLNVHGVNETHPWFRTNILKDRRPNAFVDSTQVKELFTYDPDAYERFNGVCCLCNIDDVDVDDLLKCDGPCGGVFHLACLPVRARPAVNGFPWLCPLCVGNGDQAVPVELKVQRRRVWLTRRQKRTVKSWKVAYIKIYNMCIAEQARLQRRATNAGLQRMVSDRNLNHNFNRGADSDVFDMPSKMRQHVVHDYLKNVVSNEAKKAIDPTFQYNIKPKSSRSNVSFYVDKQQFFTRRNRSNEPHHAGIIFDPNKLRVSQKNNQAGPPNKLPDHLEYDGRLIYDKLGRAFLCVAEKIERKYRPDREPVVVSIDPGVRTPHVIYDADGFITEVGPDGMDRMYQIALRADDIQSKMARATGPGKKCRRRYLRKAFLRLHDKIKRLVNDYHCRLCKWLCMTADVIIIPTFSPTQMVRRRRGRRLSKKSCRQLLTWAHYAFRQRLHFKAKEYPWVRVVECTEEYTSKTCGACGQIHQQLGGNKVFRCPQHGCGYCVGRDHNGARNILIKTAMEYADDLYGANV